jgi:A/G-specific adenine glycosylase
VLDGNVYRVLARYFGERETIFNARGKHFYQTLANELLPSGTAAQFNQALMDLGSSICKPSSPLCIECPFQIDCVAYRDRLLGELPTPKVRKELKSRYFYCLFLTDGKRISLQKRTANDIWRGLYQGITIEAEQPPKKITGLSNTMLRSLQWTPWRIQKLSHVKAHFSFSVCTIEEWDHAIDASIVPLVELHYLAVPKVIHDFLSEQKFL